jgi:hypothetical protein
MNAYNQPTATMFNFRRSTERIAKKKHFNLMPHNGLGWSGWCFQFRRETQTIKEVFTDFFVFDIKYEIKECMSVKGGKDDDYSLVIITLQDNPLLSL